MTRYEFRLPWGDLLLIEANFAEASAQICFDGTPSQFQVADARHCPWQALELFLAEQGREFWSDSDDCEIADIIADTELLEHGR